jgi:hypothetical protein
MKESINIVILPTFLNRSEYSYELFGYLASDNQVLDIVVLEKLLSKLESKFKINKFSIEGGDITLLSDLYFDLLFKLLKTYNKKISVVSQFVKYNPALINNADIIEVIYNFQNKEICKIENIEAAVATGKIINIQSYDIFLDNHELGIVDSLNHLGIKSWKILPCYTTKYSDLTFKGYDFFENIVQKYLPLSQYMKFSFYNKLQLDGVIQNNHIRTVYITPSGKFGIGIFNNNQFELIETDNLIELENLLKKQNEESILYCKNCKSKQQCLADRYFNYSYQGKSCCGFKNLIKSIN